MNIFYLDMDPTLAAQGLHDGHITSAINETCQLLSAWADWYIKEENSHYQELIELPWTALTHQNHPCSLWLRDMLGNAAWLSRYLAAVIVEYERRYNKKNNFERAREISEKLNTWHTSHWVMAFYGVPVECMPDAYKYQGSSGRKKGDVVEAYRRYYIAEKIPGNEYTEPAKMPEWATPKEIVPVKKIDISGIKIPGKSIKIGTVAEEVELQAVAADAAEETSKYNTQEEIDAAANAIVKGVTVVATPALPPEIEAAVDTLNGMSKEFQVFINVQTGEILVQKRA